MTPRKDPARTQVAASARPTFNECLIAWYRCEGGPGPTKGVKLGLANGTPDPPKATSKDWYYWGVVQKAIGQLERQGFETIGVTRLLLHRCATLGLRVKDPLAGYKLFVLVATPKASDLTGGADRQGDTELLALLHLAWATIRGVIQGAIDRSEPYLETASA